ncbi:MAG: hypothetical protein U1B83_06550, partial [Candidatus Cloacimonadaceae bacterium]|nr:hypothetical protein [Candidatus Cloacimonadaceae bacterium]
KHNHLHHRALQIAFQLACSLLIYNADMILLAALPMRLRHHPQCRSCNLLSQACEPLFGGVYFFPGNLVRGVGELRGIVSSKAIISQGTQKKLAYYGGFQIVAKK